jgi:hypothetical protein
MVCVVCCAFYPNAIRGLSEGMPNYIGIKPEVHTGEPVVWCCAVVVVLDVVLEDGLDCVLLFEIPSLCSE